MQIMRVETKLQKRKRNNIFLIHHVEASVSFLVQYFATLHHHVTLCPKAQDFFLPSSISRLSLLKSFIIQSWRMRVSKPSTSPNKAEETSSESLFRTNHHNDSHPLSPCLQPTPASPFTPTHQHLTHHFLILSSRIPPRTTTLYVGLMNSEDRFLWARSRATLQYWSAPGFWSLLSSSLKISAGRVDPTRIPLRRTIWAGGSKIRQLMIGLRFSWRTLGWQSCWRRYNTIHLNWKYKIFMWQIMFWISNQLYVNLG